MTASLRLFLLLGAAMFVAQAKAVLQLSLTPTHATCSYASGVIDATVTGGLPPYTYAWLDGPTTEDRPALLPGNYSLTVTDANLDQVTQQVDILSQPYNITSLGSFSYCNAGAQLFSNGLTPVPGITGPWYVDGSMLLQAPGSGVSAPGDTTYAFYPGTQFYTLPIQDMNGCSGTISGQTGTQITSWPSLTVTGVDPSCTNQNIGAIHIQASGPAPAYDVWLMLWDEDGFMVMFNGGYVDQFTYQADITNIGPGTYTLRWWLGATNDWLDPGDCQVDTLSVVVPSLGPACGSVQGNTWYDVNSNCVRDANEVGIPYSPLLLQPNNEVLFTGSGGYFHFPLLNGSYTLEQQDPTLVHICPAVQPIPLTIAGADVPLALANGSTQPLDLRASISSGAARPGFSTLIAASAQNLGPQLSGAVTFTVDLDPTLVYTSATPTPTSVIGNTTLSWTLPAFNSYESTFFHINAQVPVGTPLGTPLQYTATISNTLSDADPANDSMTHTEIVVGSFDPNDKAVRTSSGTSSTEYFIGTDQWLDYVIRFQNTGTDTAFTVVVTDTLPAEVDMLSFEQGAGSHPFEASFLPGRVVKWTFPSILLPDSNTNEAASHGLISFRIRPADPLLPGTSISNNADIFFDFNTPVRTNDAQVVAELSTGLNTIQDALCRAVVNNEHILLYATGDPFEARSVQVLAMDGRIVITRTAITLDRHGDAMNIAALPAGPYMICVAGQDGRMWNQRFVKL